MRIEKKNIKQLLRAEYNPRIALEPGDAEYELLQGSMKTFGYVVPIIWNEKTGRIVGGHQRLSVLQAAGVKEVQVSVVNVDEEQEKQLNIALNKIEGEWDNEALRELIQELDELGVAEATGFDRHSIDFMSAGLEELVDEATIESELEDVEETFNITLTFDVAYRADIEEYIRDNGKEGIKQLLLDKAKGLI
jgi:ParB-like chromosome segregation protein Spo0J